MAKIITIRDAKSAGMLRNTLLNRLSHDLELALDLNADPKGYEIENLSSTSRGIYYGDIIQTANPHVRLFFKYLPSDLKDISNNYVFSGHLDGDKEEIYKQLSSLGYLPKLWRIYKTDSGSFYIYDFINGLSLDTAIITLLENMKLLGYSHKLDEYRDEYRSESRDRYKNKTLENKGPKENKPRNKSFDYDTVFSILTTLQNTLNNLTLNYTIEAIKDLNQLYRNHYKHHSNQKNEHTNASLEWLDRRISRLMTVLSKDLNYDIDDNTNKMFDFFRNELSNPGYNLGDRYANNILIRTKSADSLEECIKIWHVDPDFPFRPIDMDIAELIVFPLAVMRSYNERFFSSYDSPQKLAQKLDIDIASISEGVVQKMLDHGLYNPKHFQLPTRVEKIYKQKFLASSLFVLLNTLSIIYITLKNYGSDFLRMYLNSDVRSNYNVMNLLVNKQLALNPKINSPKTNHLTNISADTPFEIKLTPVTSIDSLEVYKHIYSDYYNLVNQFNEALVKSLEGSSSIEHDNYDPNSVRLIAYSIYNGIKEILS